MIRNPISDHLITPQNSALLVIDYQPAQVGAVRSMDRELLVKNIVSTVKLARLFGLPIVHSTVNVKSRSEEHTSELQSLRHLVCRLLLEKKKIPTQGHVRPVIQRM